MIEAAFGLPFLLGGKGGALRDLLTLRDFVTSFRHPFTLAAGPLQDERPELTLDYKSTHSQRFAHCVRTSLPACGGAMQNTIKKSRSSKLDAIFHCVLRRVRDSNPRTR